ncbi:hypothetical protein EVAR_98158_1, partial [Eumeta japonica]
GSNSILPDPMAHIAVERPDTVSLAIRFALRSSLRPCAVDDTARAAACSARAGDCHRAEYP